MNFDQSQPWSEDVIDSLSKLEKFVVDSYGTRDPDITQIFSPQKKLRFQSSFEISLAAFKISVENKSIPIEHLPTIIQEVNENLSNAVISSLNPDHDYYVCFDQLDLGFDPNESKYQNRLVGLLLAARDINLKVKEFNKKMSVVVFLRDDIYEILRFEDKNKLTEAFMSRVEWDTARTRRTLKQLMEKRFATVLAIPEKDSWDTVFDETEKMTGKQSKYHHIIDRTFLRPRDMIKFCNEILGVYKSRKPSGATTQPRIEKFDNRDIQAARGEYSSYFLRELDDEIFKHLPDYKNYVEILKTLESLQFTIDEFEQALEKRKQILPTGIYPTNILKNLFDFSIISYYLPGGSGYGGSEYVWRYQDTRAQFNEAATNFRIHPALKETLALKKFTRSG